MKIAIVHARYQQLGGEDLVVEAEAMMLKSYGHQVVTYIRSNDEIATMRKLDVARNTLWSGSASAEFSRLLGLEKPDIVHVHNTFPLLSPSVYWAASRACVPVVQTLHNFRLICPQAMLLREEKICEDCVGKLPWRGVMRGCYRGSRTQTGVLAGMLAFHRTIGTYDRHIQRFIALNDFCRSKFVEAGIPLEKISIKPNFVDIARPAPARRDGFLFVGRLSTEKGISTLLDASRIAPDIDIQLAGVGPLHEQVCATPSVTTLGALTSEEVGLRMANACALVLPSIWYENFPRTLVEAFAHGLPVIASRIGAIAEIVEDGKNGLLFEPGNASALAERMRWAAAHPEEMRRMGECARRTYEERYTQGINHRQLTGIYEDVLKRFHQ